MKQKLWLRCFAVVIALVFSLAVTCYADFGDYGGDYDYGGNDYDYDYDYDDYDYDYDYGNDYDYDYDDDDYDYSSVSGYYSGSTSDDDDSSALGGFIVFVVIVALVVFFARKSKKGSKKANGGPIMPGATPTNAASLNRVEEYSALDPGFSPAEFTEKLSNMYVKFQNSWQAKNMEDLRPYLTDALYAQCDRQLDSYRRNKQTNMIERIAVLGVDLVGWKQEQGNDVMVARLKTRIVDYVVSDDTGAVVRGDNSKEKFMTYEWTLVRTTGKMSTDSQGTTAQNCPNCGAHVDINMTAKCQYCGSILTTDEFDWAVSSIKGLSQRTA